MRPCNTVWSVPNIQNEQEPFIREHPSRYHVVKSQNFIKNRKFSDTDQKTEIHFEKFAFSITCKKNGCATFA